jgi:heme/copper-type cytochrome/quinol oxidase subunit 2
MEYIKTSTILAILAIIATVLIALAAMTFVDNEMAYASKGDHQNHGSSDSGGGKSPSGHQAGQFLIQCREYCGF